MNILFTFALHVAILHQSVRITCDGAPIGASAQEKRYQFTPDVFVGIGNRPIHWASIMTLCVVSLQVQN